jgi:hypothetical protein
MIDSLRFYRWFCLLDRPFSKYNEETIIFRIDSMSVVLDGFIWIQNQYIEEEKKKKNTREL